jgi:hypothetical protein
MPPETITAMPKPPLSPLTTPLEFWEAKFAGPELIYGADPNTFLTQHVAGLPAGTALCLAEGQGRNALHLARLGHRVIVQDLSSHALATARRLAAAEGLAVETICGDLADYLPEPESVDLVVAIWMQIPRQIRQTLMPRVVAACRPGGLLILEACTPSQLGRTTGGPQVLDLLVEPADLLADVQGLELLHWQEGWREIREGKAHRGRSATVQLVGRKPPPQDSGHQA